MIPIFVYYLLDPETFTIRYIGQTKKSIDQRLKEHIWHAVHFKGRSHRFSWIRSLLSRGLEPIIKLRAIVQLDNAAEIERDLIKSHRNLGTNLVNDTDGGDGTGGHKQSEETKTKISLFQRSRVRSPITRAKISLSLTGRRLSNETRKKMSLAHIGIQKKPFSAEHCLKLSLIQRKRWELGKYDGRKLRVSK